MPSYRGALALLALLSLLALPAASLAQEADLILTNGRVWTGAEARPWVEAVAVRGDRILAVGSAAEVERHRTPHTRTIDAGGRLVTPGFIDNHTHFNRAGALLLGINLLDVAEEGLLVRRVAEARGRLPAGAWILGGDWGAYEAWGMGSTGADAPAAPATTFVPDRAMIDSVTSATPVLLDKWDRSQHLANGVALTRAGLSCARPVEGLACEGGRATGVVTGEAYERVRGVVEAKSFDQRLREARTALTHLNELGVTGIHDVTPPEQLPVYHALKQAGELSVRVYARPTLDKWDELAYVGIPMGFGDETLRIGGLKGFVDGIQGNSTARFYEPQLHSGLRGEWRDSTNTAATDGPGSGMMPPGNMERLLMAMDSAGYWPQVHAIGDEAIDSLLTLMERTMERNGEKERRFRIIHNQVIRGPDVAEREARLGIIAEMQPYHAIDDMRWMEERVGERSRWAYAFRTIHEAGVMITFGSDWPGTNAAWYTADPLKGIYAAVTRQTLDGQPEGGWYPEERIDVETALRAYTVNNAYAAGEEAIKGSLEPGKLADFAVIDRDLFEVPPAELKEARVLLTVLGGNVVHGSPPATEASVPSQGYRPGIDVLDYDLTVELPERGPELGGRAVLTVLRTAAVDTLVLDLIELRVDSVLVDGRAAAFRRDATSIHVPLPAGSGDTLRVAVRYGGEPRDGLIIRTDAQGRWTGFGDNWPDRGRHWIPSVDHPSDKATVSWTVIAPRERGVIANGVRVEERPIGADRRLTRWRTSRPIPVYLMVIGAGPLVEHPLGESACGLAELGGCVPQSVLVAPENRDFLPGPFDQADEIVEFFASRVAPYPYEKLDHVQSSTRFGGMENATAIFYSDRAFRERTLGVELIAHETAHQWFGNSVTEREWSHLWLSEGFATYFAQLWREHDGGAAALREGMREIREEILASADVAQRPVIDTAQTEYMSLLNENSYEKGGFVLHMLRSLVGDTAFFAGVRDYYLTNRHGTALTEDLVRAVEGSSGRELDDFFDQWLRRPGFPELATSWRFDAARRRVVLQVEQGERFGAYRFPLEVEVVDASGRRLRATVEVAAQLSQELVLPVELDRAPRELVLDPDVELLAAFREAGR